MITLKDIKKAVIGKIESEFETRVLENEADENFGKDGFFVYLEDIRIQSVSNTQNLYTYPVIIQFYKKKAKANDLMKVLEILSSLFIDIMRIESEPDTRHVQITNTHGEIMEDSAYLVFDIAFRDLKAQKESGAELMQELLLDIKNRR